MTTRHCLVPDRRRLVAAAAAVVGVGALGMASISPAAVTIGEDTTVGGDTAFECSNLPSDRCTFAVIQHPTFSFAAPFDGVIVRWRIRGDSKGTQFALRVVRPLAGGFFLGAGRSEPRTVAPGVENVFETRLSVSQGDFIGVNVPGASGFPEVDRRTFPGSALAVWFPVLQEGQSRSPTSIRTEGPLVYNADIEPDCDADGLGDETQDPDTLACDAAAPETTITKHPKNKTRKKRAIFEFASSEANSTFVCTLDGESSFKTCSSPLTVKVKKGKHSFQVQAVDPAGNVDPTPAAYDWKVKKKKRK
jgi:hypothetical protein